MFKLSEISNVAQRSFFNQISNGATLLQPNWTSNVVELGFQPDYCVIRSVIYNTSSDQDRSIYTVTSSLSNNQAMVSFPGSSTTAAGAVFPNISNPQKLIKLNSQPISSVSFAIYTYKTDGTNTITTSGLAAGNNSSILIEVDFLKLKSKA